MGLVKIALWQSIPLTHLELPSKQRGSFKPLLPDIDSFSEFHSIFRFRPKDSFAQLRILYHYLGFMRIVLLIFFHGLHRLQGSYAHSIRFSREP